MHLLRYGDGDAEPDFVHAVDGGCVHLVTLQRAENYLHEEHNADDNGCH